MENVKKNNFNDKDFLLKDFIVNDCEAKIRMGIKEVEERVSDASKDRKINAPLSVEEKSFLTFNL